LFTPLQVHLCWLFETLIVMLFSTCTCFTNWPFCRRLPHKLLIVMLLSRNCYRTIWLNFHYNFLVGVGMVQFGMKTEPNWTELFAKFKITELNCLHFELNWTVSNRSELFRTELNCYYWYLWKKYEKNKWNWILVTELNWTVLNWTDLFWIELNCFELNCFSSVSELLVIVQFFFGSVQFNSSIQFLVFLRTPTFWLFYYLPRLLVEEIVQRYFRCFTAMWLFWTY